MNQEAISAAAEALEKRSENDDWEWCLGDARAALDAAEPYLIRDVTGKRFTDAELAAEFHAAAATVFRDKAYGIDTAHAIRDFMTLRRFATTPHYDEEEKQ